jgi:hypothetical protein
MPNWCVNTLVIKGSPQDLREFKHRVRSNDIDPDSGKPFPIGFEQHVPEPAGLHDDEPAYNRYPDAYYWRKEHWGTKWNAMYPRRPRGSLKSGCLTYRFFTASGPPDAWMDVVAAEHRKLSFDLSFEIEYWGGGLLRWRRGRMLKPKLDMPHIS